MVEKTCIFLIKDDKLQEKYKPIWDVIKNELGFKFHSKSIYEQKYLKAKIREFDEVIKKLFGYCYTKRKYALYLHCLNNY